MAFLDETGLAELWELIQTEDAKNSKIAIGSYTGTGTYSSSSPCSLTFDFVPKFIILGNSGTSLFFCTASYTSGSPQGILWTKDNPIIYVGGTSLNGSSYTRYYIQTELNGKVFSWYSYSETSDGVGNGNSSYCYNNSGQKYIYIAIG